ncbi:MAG TPA: response regulator [Anaerolineales bacterium]|nr:response regulator [Anaerolineales bacterium]
MDNEAKVIVCIDDDPEIITLMGLIFRPQGFRLIGAVSGPEGLKVMRRVKPDLVLLDLMMPEMSGWEVYRQMQADEGLRHIPVVIVTVRAQPIERTIGLHVFGVEDYITKPFEIRDLVRSVRRVLGASDEGESPS